MTEQELLDYGYKKETCKIGKLYFRGYFFCKFKEDGVVDLRTNDNDMHTFALVNSMDELYKAERSYYENMKNNYLQKIKLIDVVIKLYDEKINKEDKNNN